ncbi:MAG TPA: ABC transporter permease [Candidatus Limnocylindrales bacterium]|nr:ABC transporter permease [Candidatus Limnocylindrales bacterium]
MIADLRTMFWKEWRSLVRGKARRQALLTGGILATWSVWFPIQMGGRDWVSDPIPMGILGILMPMILVGVAIPDAIAGERERRTLSTLLASRMSDRAILYGKLGFAVGVGWLASPLVLGVSLIVANLTTLDAAPLFFELDVLLGVLVLGFLCAVLTGAVGIFVGLRSETVQEAQQLTLLGVMAPGMLIGFGATALLANREFARGLIDFLGSPGAKLLALGAVGVLVVLDAFLVAAADRRFRRGRLLDRGR